MFRSDWLWYEAETDTASAAITATPDDGGATVVTKIDDELAPTPVTFEAGLNTLTIEVTVGDETAVYTVWVTYTPT